MASRRVVSPEKLEEFHLKFFLPLVRRAIRRHGLSNEDARDVVQEAFVVALAKLGSTSYALAWLKQVVDFQSINLKRTSARRARLLAQWAGTSLPEGSTLLEVPADEI